MNSPKLAHYYKVKPETGLIEGGRFIPSPNFNERPDGVEPELIVVHGISLPPNQFGGPEITQLFTNKLDPAQDPYFKQIKDLKVSAHALIRRDGEVIQYVPFHLRAWHAGISSFGAREGCNDFSIGIELEGTDATGYTASQYQSLARLIKGLWLAYPSLSDRNVVGHCDIAPGRKSDPGPYFLWTSLHRLLES